MLTNYFGRVNTITRFVFIRNNILKGRDTTFQKEEKMENETLFNEDAEPPGTAPGLVKAKNDVTDFFSLQLETSQPNLAKQKPDRIIFPFKDSPRARSFRKKHYPDITRIEWFDWHWQMQNAIRDVKTLDKMLHLSDNERQAMMHQSGALPVAITPYYASLLDP